VRQNLTIRFAVPVVVAVVVVLPAVVPVVVAVVVVLPAVVPVVVAVVVVLPAVVPVVVATRTLADIRTHLALLPC
jgi:hypothetical protein